MDLLFDEKNHAYSKDGVDYVSVTHVLGAVGAYSFSKKTFIEQSLTNSFLQKYAKEGTEIHKTLERFDNCEDIDSLLIEKYQEALSTLDVSEFVVIEGAFCDDEDFVAGTIDRVFVNSFDQHCILDIKRKGKGNKNKKDLLAYQAQIGAYALLYQKTYNTEIEKCFILEINSGAYKVHSFPTSDCIDLWNKAFDCYKKGLWLDDVENGDVLMGEDYDSLANKIQMLREMKKEISVLEGEIKEELELKLNKKNAIIGKANVHVTYVAPTTSKFMSKENKKELNEFLEFHGQNLYKDYYSISQKKDYYKF